MRYTPSAIFETFPFPLGLEPSSQGKSSPSSRLLDELGERLHEGRCAIMTALDIGLTTLYNLYNDPGLSTEAVAKTAKCSEDEASRARKAIEELRDLHVNIDKAVRDAYDWGDIPLEHSFHELEFLSENDRVRCTVSLAARKEILKRLLELNHQRHEEEFAAGLVDKDGKRIKKKPGTKRKRTSAADRGQRLPLCRGVRTVYCEDSGVE
jgi:hypothetical protein